MLSLPVLTTDVMFRCVPMLGTVSCNIMLSGYEDGGLSVKALQFFYDMALMRIVVDRYDTVALLDCR
jgi:pentatricopeptide repeat protein